ncbi:MBL fold metallo-hydrolase [Pseudonocardia sp. CA-107938]|uniref:MBL fold metallo-hydrolase n=1 Tax=Pseudonocardia sp. CA-107938 TaxID=3240021 RepID=UPI003D9232CC
MTVTALHVGGPTLVLDLSGIRIVTDPTFDPPGPHPVGARVLVKLSGPAVAAGDLGTVDLVLLSHDHHPDNLDDAGRALLPAAGRVLSTEAAAERIPGVRGLAPWEAVEIDTPEGPMVVTAVPARHGPPGSEAVVGPVIGFVLQPAAGPTVYVSGDNASIGIVERIAERFPAVDLAVLFCGAARRLDMAEALTLTAVDAVLAAKALDARRVVPVHAEGWLHFTESVGTVARAYAEAGLADRLTVLQAGVATELFPAEVSA